MQTLTKEKKLMYLISDKLNFKEKYITGVFFTKLYNYKKHNSP